jgi:hypothetical protein
MKNFYIYFLDGTKEKSEGINEGDAFRRAGYGGRAINAVDVISEKDDYIWIPEEKTWRSKEYIKNKEK